MQSLKAILLSSALVTPLLAPGLSAQVLKETFDGPNLPANFTVRSGTWKIQNQRAVQTVGSLAYMTLNNVMLYNCVVEADVYWTGLNVNYGGVTSRHDGSAGNNSLLAKVQSNGATVAGFDTAWSYENPGGANALTAITPLMTKTRVRLIAVGNMGYMQIDSDQDGIYDKFVAPRTYTTHTVPGLVGLGGYASGAFPAEIDNFAYYDAVLMEDSTGNTTPKIGTTYDMVLTTQETAITPFLCAISLTGSAKGGNLTGIPIGGGRSIPLGADPILDLSLTLGGALGLTGVTDASGVGKPKINIPNMSVLVGIDVFVAGVTINGGGIHNISNDHHVKFVQ